MHSTFCHKYHQFINQVTHAVLTETQCMHDRLLNAQSLQYYLQAIKFATHDQSPKHQFASVCSAA